MSFELRHGTNISHWLSQSERRGEERRAWFQRDDVQRLTELGLDHLRLPLDEEQLWDEDGRAHGDAFELLHGALGWCEEAGLRAIADLHIVRTHHFNGAAPVFTDASARDSFLACWERLSAELEGYGESFLAYELLNEPVADDPEQWNDLAAAALAVVRAREAERTVVLGSNRWSGAGQFPFLRVPDDRRLVLTFHFYEPMVLTHYRAPWTPAGEYDGPVSYPGQLIPEELFDAAPADVRSHRSFDAAAMEALIEPALSVARNAGLPLYCGEFGVFESVPDELRERWYDDLFGVFAKHGVGWASWDWKGGFALMREDGSLTAPGRAIRRALSSVGDAR
jgi:endoglucanase